MVSETEEISVAQLSDWTGEPPEALDDWKARGLIGVGATEFALGDIEGVTLVRFLLRRGMTLDDMQRAEQIRGWMARHARESPILPRMPRRLSDVAQEIGMELDQAERIWEAAGLSDQGDLVDPMDRAMLRGVKMAFASGFPEAAMLSLLRVYYDTLSRAAEASARTIHAFVHDRIQSEGGSGDQAFDQVESAAAVVRPMQEPTVLYFLRKGARRAAREDVAVHLSQDLGRTRVPDVLGTVHRAISFTDLSASTPLAAQKGDADAAVILDRFSTIIRASVPRWDGHVVKQIGDEFMLVFPDAASAVTCLIDVHARARQEHAFPAVRSGINSGELLYREGDYVGTVVNVAARLISIAQPDQIVVGPAARREVGRLTAVEFRRLGRRAIKGLPDEIEVFEACGSSASSEIRVADPVCGLEMLATNVGAKLTLDGVDRVFCSDECLRTFVMNPAAYQAGSATNG